MRHLIPIVAALTAACQAGGPAAPEARASTVRGASLGAATMVPPPELAAAMQLEHEVRQQGRLVTAVEAGSAAARAGLRADDVLLELDGVTLYSQDDVDDVLATRRPGAVVSATVVRAGGSERRALDVTLGAGAPLPAGRIRWQHASLAHLADALDQARAEKKQVLVGLSGAET